MIEFQFRGDAELDAMARRLDEVPRRLRRELRSGLAAAARPATRDVRQEIKMVSLAQRRTWSAKSSRRVGRRLGRGSSPLRAPIAQAVELQADVGQGDASVEIRLRDTRVPLRARWLVPYVTGRRGRLRHPFMGDWGHAVQATGNLNVWWTTLRRHMADFRRERDQAVDRVARQI